MRVLFIGVALWLTGCSNFYVKVIDQYGEPVPDVNVQVGSLFNFFIVSSGVTSFKTTSRNGRFTVGNSSVGIEFIEKNGYEFSSNYGYGSTYFRENYKREHGNSYFKPYYILAWKRDVPEPLVSSNGSRGVRLVPGEYYKIDFSKGGRYQAIGTIERNTQSVSDMDADLVVFLEQDPEVVMVRGKEYHRWTISLTVPQGGLQKVKDIMPNRAPDSGYKSEPWIISYDDRYDDRYIDSSVGQQFYIKSRGGETYGQFTFSYNPGFGVLSFGKFWVNENGSRNLTRPKRYIYCRSQFAPKDCSLDDYGP